MAHGGVGRGGVGLRGLGFARGVGLRSSGAALLAFDPQTVIKHLPQGEPSAAFIAERTKEAVAAGRVLGRGMFDPKLPRHLHRLTMPTLLVWGRQDRLTPTAQHETWVKALPKAVLKLFDQAGHLVLDEAPEAVGDIAEFLA